ncbi:hypothetical protein F4703DRAFT_1882680 [Phycomyces blakesleeanus]
MFLTLRRLSSAQTLVRRPVFTRNAPLLTRLMPFHSTMACTNEPSSEPASESASESAATGPNTTTKLAKSKANKKAVPEMLSPERLQAIMQRLVESPPSQSLEAERSDLIMEIDSHRINSNPRGISAERYNKLIELLNRCYNVAQLREYIKAKGIAPKKLKRAVLRQIANECWGVLSEEQVHKELKSLKARQVRQQVSASKEELFFVIGNNGATLRNIENMSKATITIDVSKSQYVLEGLPEEVEIARQEIKSCLPIVKKEYDIPQLKDDMAKTDFAVQSKNLLSDISKISNTYISINDGKFHIAALSQKSLDSSKRQLELVLTEMGYTDKKPLSVSDHTLIAISKDLTNLSVKPKDFYSLTPIHDASAMPLSARNVGWSRVVHDTNHDQYRPFGSQHQESLLRMVSNKSESEQSTIEFSKIADLLRDTLKVSDETKENISVEAFFGHLLLKNPVTNQTQMNLLTPGLEGSFGFEQFQNIMNERYYERRIFFPTTPPANFVTPLIPIEVDGSLHKRIIQAHYVNTSLLTSLDPRSKDNGLERLTVEFSEQNDGSIKLDRVLGEHGRAAVDAICVSGRIDMRILAKRYSLYTNEQLATPEGYVNLPLPSSVEELIKKCSLIGYNELSCPNFWSQDNVAGSNMALVDVSFKNERQHLIDDCLVTLSHTQKQEGHTGFNELKVTHVTEDAAKNNYLPVKNGLASWKNMASTLEHLARRWEY